MMAKLPEDRYATPSQAAQALDVFLLAWRARDGPRVAAHAANSSVGWRARKVRPMRRRLAAPALRRDQADAADAGRPTEAAVDHSRRLLLRRPSHWHSRCSSPSWCNH